MLTFRMRETCCALAVALSATLGATGSAQAGSVFDFASGETGGTLLNSGGSFGDDYWYFEHDGITMTAEAWKADRQVDLGRGSTGLYIKHGWLDNHQVDGFRGTETIWLEVTPDVRWEKVWFSHVDAGSLVFFPFVGLRYIPGNDDVRVHFGPDSLDFDLSGIGSGLVMLDLSALDMVGGRIGFEAAEANDEWKLRGVSVTAAHAVPTPGAALAGGVLLALTAVWGRRRHAHACRS